MARFGLVGPSYQSQSINADCQKCVNFYVENIESQQGKGAMALYPTPGLAVLYNLSSVGVRGLITVQGRTFVIAGTVLWELLPPTASPNRITRGSIPSDGQPVSMAGGGTQLLIASVQTAYVFDLVANTLTPVAQLAGIPIAQVGYSDGFFLVLVANSTKIQSSGTLDATSWPGTNFTGVQVFSDNANAIYFDHREMWVFSPKQIQPYFDSGNFPFPFDTVQGAYIESGLAAPFSVAKLDNSLFWLGSDERGNGVVRRAQGYIPIRVSNHAVEFAMQGYTTISDAVAYGYQDQGHEFYVLGFPSADRTWVYDAATGMWHERGFWNKQAGAFNRHRAAFHTFNFGLHLVGDPTTGAVYKMAINITDDFGNAIKRVRRAPHISNEQEWTFHSKLQVDVETGLGPNPPLQGNAQSTVFLVADTNSVVWQISVNDTGVLQTSAGSGAPGNLFLTDPSDNTSWQIKVTTLGALNPVSVPFSATYPGGKIMVSNTGSTQWSLTIKDLGGGLATLQTSALGIVARGPLMMMRFSNDGGHTWSNEQDRDCGQSGEYTKRVIWRRLGRSRDRVYEISVTDPIPWRIVDAYLDASPGFVPQERMISEARKRA